MSYKDELFAQHGQPCPDANINISAWLLSPDGCKAFDQIRRNDESAAELIAECERMIEMMVEYRQDLAARYNALATMTSEYSVSLERLHNHRRIVYWLSLFAEFADGRKEIISRETFDGRDRRKALKRFEELKKERPGIKAILDIEKEPWER